MWVISDRNTKSVCFKQFLKKQSKIYSERILYNVILMRLLILYSRSDAAASSHCLS